MNVKVTPWIHSTEEVTLELSTEYKVLAGEALNGIPVISNRKFESKVRVRLGQAVVVAGLYSEGVSKTKGGLPVLANYIPALRSNTADVERRDLLLVLTPKLSAVPPAETSTRPVWVGTESRPLTPIAQ